MGNFYCAGCGNLHKFTELEAERLIYLLSDKLANGGAGLTMRLRGNHLEVVVCFREVMALDTESVYRDEVPTS